MRASLIGCAVLLGAGCAGAGVEAPQQEQGHAEATKEQGRSPGATHEENRCGTRKIDRGDVFYTTNDVSGCPNGGVLRGTEKDDKLAGEDGEDEVHGLGGDDVAEGGVGDDKVYGGPGDDNMMGAGAMDSNEPGDDMVYGGPGRDDIGGDRGDDVLYGGEGDDHQVHGWYGDDTLYGGPGDDEGINAGEGEDTLYGGEGNDQVLAGGDGQRDELYCGDGTDTYTADEIDVVADDCEEKTKEEGPQKVEECPPNALCAPPNEHRVPDVVGMTVPEAYRTLSRSGYGCAIWAERSGQQAGPRRVAAQKEKPGSKGFAAQLIHLTVSKPYPEGYHHPGKGLLPPDCVDQRNYPR